MLKGPLIKRATGNFRALIGSYRRRIATEDRDAVQNTHDLNTGNTESGDDRRALLREVIHTGQALNPTAQDLIHRLCQVRRIGAKKRKPLSRQPFMTPSAFYAQPAQMIKAVYAPVFNMKAFTGQKLRLQPRGEY